MNNYSDYNTIPIDNAQSTALPGTFMEDAYASRHRVLYLGAILVGMAISAVIYALSSGMSWEYATKIALVYGLAICAVHAAWRLRSKPRNYLSPDLFFILFYAAFHYSFLVLWMLGIVSIASQAAARVFRTPEQYPFDMLIVNLGLLGFLFGYELLAPRKEAHPPAEVRKIPTGVWTMIGLMIMALGLIIHLAFIFGVGIKTFMDFGYTVYIYMERFSSYPRLWRIQSHIFALGFGIYITSVALRYGRLFKGKIGITIFLTYLLLLALEGARTQLVTQGMILLLVRHFLIKPIKLKSLIILTIIALFVFSSIRIVRNVAAFNPSKMIKELKQARESKMTHWYDSLVEMGSSVGTVNLTTMVVPNPQPYWYGRSYLQATVHIIPYMSTVLGPQLGLAPSGWLTYTHYGFASAGTGFSLPAEGYLNFGLAGVFFQMAVLGIILRKIYANFAINKTAAGTLVFIVAYGLFMIIVRNHVNLLIAPLVRIILAAWLLKSFCGEQIVAAAEPEEPLIYEQQQYEAALSY